MKHILFCLALFCFPTMANANEQLVTGDVPIATCAETTYLAAVDVTVGENCTGAQDEAATRTLQADDDIAASLHASWAMPYTLQRAPAVPLVRKKLAILDTGFTTTSPWLQSFVTATYDVTTDTTAVHDTARHGTAVAASAILAMQHAPVELLIIKIDTNGRLSIANIVKGINYAIEQQADVINMSIGGTKADQHEQQAIEAALNAGIAIFASSGNDGHTSNVINYPAAYNGVFSIGAMNEQQQRAHFSTYNDKVLGVVPGAAVPLPQGDTIRPINGTSFSSPFAAGLAAATLQYSDASYELLRHAFAKTAKDIHTAGYDEETGYGILNGDAALHWLRGQEQPLYETARDFVTITFSAPVAIDTDIALYANGQKVISDTTVQQNTVTVSPVAVDASATYTIKIDRSITSDSGQALSEPLYVPVQFLASARSK